MKLDDEEPWGARVKERGPRREGEAKAIEKRPNVSGKVLELRCIVGEQTVCLGGLRCGLMPAIGGGLPQLCVSRISGGEKERKRSGGDGKGPDAEFLERGQCSAAESRDAQKEKYQ